MTAMADRTPLRRGIAVAAAVGAAVTLLGGCHIPSEGNGSDFLVKNTTSMTLKVVTQGQNPNATPPPGTGGLTPVTLKPGDSVGLFIGLSRGNCTALADLRRRERPRQHLDHQAAMTNMTAPSG